MWAGVVFAGTIFAACAHAGGTHTSSLTTAAHKNAKSSSKGSIEPATTDQVTTVTTATACQLLTAAANQTQGAAGTIVGTISLTNPGTGSCTILGYPMLFRFDSSGTPVAAIVDHGLTVNVSGPATQAPTLVTLAPNHTAEFTYQYSDVPTGSEATCASSTTLSVTTPGMQNETTPVPLTMAPCTGGTIEVSPIYAATTS